MLLVDELEHENAPQHTDLCRGEACADRAPHECRHPLDEATEVIIERLDLSGAKT